MLRQKQLLLHSHDNFMKRYILVFLLRHKLGLGWVGAIPPFAHTHLMLRHKNFSCTFGCVEHFTLGYVIRTCAFGCVEHFTLCYVIRTSLALSPSFILPSSGQLCEKMAAATFDARKEQKRIRSAARVGFSSFGDPQRDFGRVADVKFQRNN